MPGYKYKARDANGKLLGGILEADDDKDLAAKLAGLDITLIDSKPIKGTPTNFYI